MKILTLKTSLTLCLSLAVCGISQAQLSSRHLDSSQVETMQHRQLRKQDKTADPDLKTIVTASEIVILADIGKSQSRWVGKKIVTDWDVRVRDVLKGRPAEKLIVTTYGGEVGNIAQDFSHSAQLVTGETAILHLAPHSASSAKLSPKGHMISYDNFGVIRILRPGESKSRLKHNRRLKRDLEKIKSDIKAFN